MNIFTVTSPLKAPNNNNNNNPRFKNSLGDLNADWNTNLPNPPSPLNPSNPPNLLRSLNLPDLSSPLNPPNPLSPWIRQVRRICRIGILKRAFATETFFRIFWYQNRHRQQKLQTIKLEWFIYWFVDQVQMIKNVERITLIGFIVLDVHDAYNGFTWLHLHDPWGSRRLRRILLSAIVLIVYSVKDPYSSLWINDWPFLFNIIQVFRITKHLAKFEPLTV